MELENMRVRFSFASVCALFLFLYRRPRFPFPRIFDCPLCSDRLADWIYATRITPFADFEMHRAPDDVGSDFCSME